MLGKSGDWEKFLESDRLSPWTNAKVREQDEGRQCIAQQILKTSTDVSRRIIALADG